MKRLKINLRVSWLRVVTAVIIVVVILYSGFFLLSNPSIFTGNKDREMARLKLTEWMLSRFQEAIQQYTKDCGAPPSELQWLTINPGVAGWAGPYIKVDKAFYLLHRYDRWGTPYRYEMVDGRPTVISAGPDKVFGTKDDIQVKP